MYKGLKVLDIHAHVSAPNNGTTALSLLLASNTPLSANPLESELPALGMTEEGWAQANARHLALLDDQQIDAQLLGPRPFLMLGWMQPHLLAAWARFVNNMIAKQVSLTPSRFVGAAQLPQNPDAEDLSHCLPELDRCIHELGFKGVYLSPDPSGDRRSPGMNTRYWHPVYRRCEELDIPIIVHGTNCCDPRLAPIPANYQIGFVWEQYLATQLFLHGDVFDRFPKLKVVICHCGGALDRFIPEDKEHNAQNLRIGNLWFDTNALDLHFLEAALKQRTSKRMCFGTEVPGSGRAVRKSNGRPGDDLVPIIGGFDFLTEDDKTAIFNTNPGMVCPALGAL
jgi:predicted TIM-barrel fold metal-dependent hydrolase